MANKKEAKIKRWKIKLTLDYKRLRESLAGKCFGYFVIK